MCPIMREKLRFWSIKFTIVHVIITALLLILKDVFSCLPVHAKNLLKTENQFIVESFCPENPADKSEFVYIGLALQLQKLIIQKMMQKKN